MDLHGILSRDNRATCKDFHEAGHRPALQVWREKHLCSTFVRRAASAAHAPIRDRAQCKIQDTRSRDATPTRACRWSVEVELTVWMHQADMPICKARRITFLHTSKPTLVGPVGRKVATVPPAAERVRKEFLTSGWKPAAATNKRLPVECLRAAAPSLHHVRWRDRYHDL